MRGIRHPSILGPARSWAWRQRIAEAKVKRKTKKAKANVEVVKAKTTVVVKASNKKNLIIVETIAITLGTSNRNPS